LCNIPAFLYYLYKQAEKDYQAEQTEQMQAAMQKTMQKNILMPSDKTKVKGIWNN